LGAGEIWRHTFAHMGWLSRLTKTVSPRVSNTHVRGGRRLATASQNTGFSSRPANRALPRSGWSR
jgi:hypothetical protein